MFNPHEIGSSYFKSLFDDTSAELEVNHGGSL